MQTCVLLLNIFYEFSLGYVKGFSESKLLRISFISSSPHGFCLSEEPVGRGALLEFSNRFEDVLLGIPSKDSITRPSSSLSLASKDLPLFADIKPLITGVSPSPNSKEAFCFDIAREQINILMLNLQPSLYPEQPYERL